MTEPETDRPASPRPIREALSIAGVGLALAVAGAWWAGRPVTAERPRFAAASARDRLASGPYIGTEACSGCHPGEAALYPKSGHAGTLRVAADIPLARQLDGRTIADPEQPGVSWSYRHRGGEFFAERAEAGAAEKIVFDFAFGSGHHATTFLTLLDPATPAALEHRLTHYSEGVGPKVTPGQRDAAPVAGTAPRGRVPSPSDTLKCFACHATRISDGGAGLDLKALIPNVSCEKCHGPGRAHVEAARAGRTDLGMPSGTGNWTAESQMQLCGECHRHPSRAAPGIIRPDNPGLARFQPVGIMQSACYTRSGGAMSCVTCHDPHGRASADRVSYEKACLQCHGSPKATACSVSPRDGCIECHMPKVDSGQHILFTDHWIRVRREPPKGRAP